MARSDYNIMSSISNDNCARFTIYRQKAKDFACRLGTLCLPCNVGDRERGNDVMGTSSHRRPKRNDSSSRFIWCHRP